MASRAAKPKVRNGTKAEGGEEPMSPRSRDEIERNSARYSAPLVCSFCNKPHADVRKMIAGRNNVAICDECVEVCNDILVDTSARQSSPDEHEPDDEPHLFSFRCPACGHKWKAAKKR